MTTVNQLMKLRERSDTKGLLLRYVKGPSPMPAGPIFMSGLHVDGHDWPRGWNQRRRKKRKRKKLARRAQRGR